MYLQFLVRSFVHLAFWSDSWVGVSGFAIERLEEMGGMGHKTVGYYKSMTVR